ncbi:MAG: phosphate ABC transporter substrate-binding protein [Chitinophagaceae bacterium]|nr:phosphate ABC transporter substrate-binding protein [Anaerolineae bacterium]
MHPGKRTLAIVALTTTLMSCSARMTPASTPTAPTTALRLYATTAALPLVTGFSTAYSETHPNIRFDIRSGSYQTMLDELLIGETPFFLSNHLPADSTLWAAPLGQDGIAIIVNPSLDVQELTLEQLRGIYEGRITNWETLGGAHQEIVVVSREDGSGTRAGFERLVMGRRSTTANSRIAPSSASMIESVAALPGSIGYVSMSYLDERVRALTIEGVAPTLANVSANRYPLRTTLYIVGLTAPENAYLNLISWMQAPEGQSILAQHYAPLDIPLVIPTAP